MRGRVQILEVILKSEGIAKRCKLDAKTGKQMLKKNQAKALIEVKIGREFFSLKYDENSRTLTMHDNGRHASKNTNYQRPNITTI